MQEVISNNFITEKNEKLCQTRYKNSRDPPKEQFQIKLPQIFDGCTDEPVVQCDVQAVANTFMDDSK